MKKFIIIAILMLATFLRLYQLGQVPVALTGDEVAFGYNAYSILQTGHDEYGAFMPVVFKSFGDYKPPVFVYLLVPIVKVFGLNELAIRLPIAIMGILLVGLVYLIALEIYKKKPVAYLAALFMAISPWAVQFSRVGWEATMALFFTTLAVYLFLRGLSSKWSNIWFLSATLLCIVAFHSYHAEKIITTLLIALVYILFRKRIKISNRFRYILVVIFLISITPTLVGLTNISGQSRARGSLISDYLFSSTKDLDYQASDNLIDENNNPLDRLVFSSHLGLSISDIASKLYAYISPANVFVYGDEVGRHGVEDFGVLYHWEFLIILGAVILMVRKKKEPMDFLVIGWILIGLLPAIITKDKLHSIRSLGALPPLYILEGWGAYQIITLVSNKYRLLVKPMVVVGVLVILIGLGRFMVSYLIYTPVDRAAWWQYGYKQAVLDVVKEQDRFDQVVVDVPRTYGNPYIFFLFYQKYNPLLFNQTVKREDDLVHKVVPVYSFGKYQFRDIYWPADRLKRHTLFVGTDHSLPKSDVSDSTLFKILYEERMPDQTVVFRIVETL